MGENLKLPSASKTQFFISNLLKILNNNDIKINKKPLALPAVPPCKAEITTAFLYRLVKTFLLKVCDNYLLQNFYFSSTLACGLLSPHITSTHVENIPCKNKQKQCKDVNA